jgi:vacuolar protein-sorting-associated protein 4
LLRCITWLLLADLPPLISKTDFEKVLARQRPTVGKDLEVHEKFTKEFGDDG